MTEHYSPDVSHDCLSRKELLAYSTGCVSPARLETIHMHLISCSQCTALLEELERENDTFILRLKKSARQEVHPAEPPTTPEAVFDEADTILQQAISKAEAEAKAKARASWRIGPYEVIRVVKRGGMGEVYLARQPGLNREVAIKMIASGEEDNEELLRRFYTEAEAVARLQHANIIEVFASGTHEGRPYFSMEYMAGGNLEDFLKRQPLAEREAASLVRCLALAMHYAHEKGVLHRDLKPSNILLTPTGEPKISDFGLAKILDPQRGDLTMTDAILGTPGYMAPEQAAGRVREFGRHTDVYALGAVLYRILTGVPPFRGENRMATLELSKTQPPVPPTHLKPRVSRKLEAICLRCLEKPSDKRYPTAKDLADDLDLWLQGEWGDAGKPTRRLLLAMGACFLVASALPFRNRMSLSATPATERGAQSPPFPEIREEGKTVLIGPEGKPTWYRQFVNKDPKVASPNAQNYFTLTSAEIPMLSMVELVPTVPFNSYRLRAEVWHVATHNYTNVGIYVGHRSYPTSLGEVHFSCQFRFNEFQDLLRDWEGLKQRIKDFNAPPPGGPREFRLSSELYSADIRSLEWTIPPAPNGFFEPRVGEIVWRRLEMTVTPDVVVARFDDKPPLEIELGELNRCYRERHSKLHLTWGHEVAQSIIPDFPRRGGVGLFVYNGTACFRNVTLEKWDG